MKQFPISEAVNNIVEETIDGFTWNISDKEEAEKLRRSVNMALLRKKLNGEYSVTVISAIKNNQTEITYFVNVEKNYELNQ